jgi:ABC-type glutathione transport system ATPase component
VIQVDGLNVTFHLPGEPIHAVRDVSFTVAPGECLAIVGESGSGKSVTARALVGLAGQRAARRGEPASTRSNCPEGCASGRSSRPCSPPDPA